MNSTNVQRGVLAAPPVAFLLGYGVLYCMLDWVSYVQPLGGTDLTAWNPQWALAVAVMARARNLTWPLLVTLLAAAVQPLMRHWPAVYLVESSVEILGNAVTALALRRWLGPAPAIVTRKSYLVFMIIVIGGAALQSALFALVLTWAGGDSANSVRSTLFGGWVGSANLVIALPLILALCDSVRRAELLAVMRTVEWWLLAISALVVADTVFFRPMGDQFKHFYLMFVPVAWASARFGSSGAVAVSTCVQLLLIVAVQSLPYEPQTVFELHMLLVALGATGLLIGATIDEQRQAERDLRASLHAAAAANMAAALAHELNQPLASLVSYARATQLLAERMPAHEDTTLPSIVDVTRKLTKEALRASEVVRRLRDFFRERGTERERADVAALLDDVVHDHLRKADAAGIAIEWRCPASLAPVLMDKVQIEVVLRNLVANALHAAAQATTPRVSLSADRRGPNLVVEVEDSGPGIDATEVISVFETRRSTKPGGMGIGLAISRSIVEAHRGRLWAEPGPGGRFYMSLPLSLPADADA
ncbi:MAG TPA: ATP-binding protein [Burkholderiaceae bacterium]|nr:ATP-binding protein [Burkholderiaceae bacterium]